MNALTRLETLPHSGRFAELARSVGSDVTAIPGGFRLRQGNWRALLRVQGAEVSIERIKNRRDA